MAAELAPPWRRLPGPVTCVAVALGTEPSARRRADVSASRGVSPPPQRRAEHFLSVVSGASVSSVRSGRSLCAATPGSHQPGT